MLKMPLNPNHPFTTPSLYGCLLPGSWLYS